MSISIGNINIANEIVELHFQNLRTQMLLDFLLSNNYNLTKPSQQDLNQIEEKAIEILNKKFPDMGIKRK